MKNFEEVGIDLRAFEAELGLPDEFLDRLLLEGDEWSFVIKAHALIEATVAHGLAERVDVRHADHGVQIAVNALRRAVGREIDLEKRFAEALGLRARDKPEKVVPAELFAEVERIGAAQAVVFLSIVAPRVARVTIDHELADIGVRDRRIEIEAAEWADRRIDCVGRKRAAPRVV